MEKHPLKRSITSTLMVAMLVLSPLAALCSCSFLPVEEDPPPPPILRSYEKVEYTLVEATRGEIVETVNVPCQYAPALDETLSFSIGNLPITNVYVSNGDLVSKGDILAELDSTDVDLQIEAQKVYLEKLKLELSRLIETHKANLQIETLKLESLIEKHEAAEGDEKQALVSSIERQNQAISSMIEAHELQSDIYNIRLNVAREKLDELLDMKSKRVLIAGIDGTVTHVKDVGVKSYSTEKEKFITIADKSTSVFKVSGDKASLFSVGDSVEIQIAGTYHEATVVDAHELNLERSDNITYLQLNETAFDIKENATGLISLELNRKENVVYVPSSAVKTANGQEIVYMLDEDNNRTMQKVVTGFSADGKVEIKDGLKPGDLVILE